MTSYEKYLRSPRWHVRAQLAREMAGWKCERCGNGVKTLEVHHVSYARLGNEHPLDLVCLCPDCHIAVHRDMTNRRRQQVPRGVADDETEGRA